MLTKYSEISADAKVFLFPSSKKFYDNELEIIQPKIETFLSNWKVDKVSYKIDYQRFLLFFVESDTVLSTKILDELTSLIFEIENELSITLLDKVNICFKQGEYVQYQDMKKFRTLIKNKSVSKKTVIFNHLIQSKEDYENDFEVPILDSWLGYLFK